LSRNRADDFTSRKRTATLKSIGRKRGEASAERTETRSDWGFFLAITRRGVFNSGTHYASTNQERDAARPANFQFIPLARSKSGRRS